MPRIFFDFDGTILDISSRWYRLHFDLAKKYDLPIYQFDDYVRLKRSGLSEEDVMTKISSQDEKIAKYCSDRLSLIEDEKYLAFDKPFDGIELILKSARKLGPMYLITKRASRKSVLDQLEKYNLGGYFESVLVTEGGDKGDLLLREFGEVAGDLIFSDAYDDYAMATDLKMRPYVVGYGCRSVDYFRGKGVVEIVETVADLQTIIDNLLKNEC